LRYRVRDRIGLERGGDPEQDERERSRQQQLSGGQRRAARQQIRGPGECGGSELAGQVRDPAREPRDAVAHDRGRQQHQVGGEAERQEGIEEGAHVARILLV
jgi:hypothetical protein